MKKISCAIISMLTVLHGATNNVRPAVNNAAQPSANNARPAANKAARPAVNNAARPVANNAARPVANKAAQPVANKAGQPAANKAPAQDQKAEEAQVETLFDVLKLVEIKNLVSLNKVQLEQLKKKLTAEKAKPEYKKLVNKSALDFILRAIDRRISGKLEANDIVSMPTFTYAVKGNQDLLNKDPKLKKNVMARMKAWHNTSDKWINYEKENNKSPVPSPQQNNNNNDGLDQGNQQQNREN